LPDSENLDEEGLVATEAMVRRSLICFVSGALFWLVGLVGAVDDPDVFSLEDFRDRTELHHEHLVFLAGLAGLIMFIAAGVFFVGELRGYSPPPYEVDPRQRV
jgi:hypothetical protein